MPRAQEPKPSRARPRKPKRPGTRRKGARRRRSALGHQGARILALAAALAAAVSSGSGCGSDTRASNGPELPVARVSDGPHEVAVLHMRELGEIRIELLPEIAPTTVENFKTLAAQHFFDGTSFHRVIPGFMIQGGDPNTRNHDPRDDGQGGPAYTIPDEFSDYPLERGAVAMAHKGQPHTAGSQFFILHGDARRLDGKYTAFGRVAAGMDVVDAITRLEIDKYGRFGPRDRPYPKAAVIESVEILPPAPTPAPVAGDLDPPRPAG